MNILDEDRPDDGPSAPLSGLKHYRVTLASPWTGEWSTEIHGWVPACSAQRRQEHPNLTGRAAVTVECGSFSCLLRPNARQLRELAHALTCLADNLDIVAVGLRPGPYDDELTAGVARMVGMPPTGRPS